MKALLLKIFREGVGGLMAFISYLTTPIKVKRTAEQQAEIDKEVEGLSLYQYFACPFCIKTRRTIRSLKLPIEYRDAQIRGGKHRQDLEQQGGQIKVPCLRIDENGSSQWLYESNEIIAYLNKRFGPKQEA